MKALVTGGGGFLGKAIALQLLARGDAVRTFSRGDYPELRQMGAEHFQGDIADGKGVASAAHGCDIVFHVAAKAGLGGRYGDYYQANVVGTENVLAACRQNGIGKLVYTSSLSVVFNGKDMEDVDESVPYADHFEAHYPQTKAIAEKMVLDANVNTMATVALRPHLIWGPGDNHLIPRILARAKAGRLRRIGTANKIIDTIYIDNAAEAHLLAADRLHPGSPIAGKVYFITQGEPIPLWDLINRILAAADLPPVEKSIPFPVAYSAGWLLEKLFRVLRPNAEPPMTRFLARELTTAHWFNIEAAKRDLGFQPPVSLDEGLHRLAAEFKSSSR